MVLFLLLLFTTATVILSFLYFKFHYWHQKGVVTLETNMFLGSWLQTTTLHHTKILQDLYHRFSGQVPVAGFYIFTQPVAVALDMDLVQSVLIKDFNYFKDRLTYKNSKDILSAHLFNLEGTKWRPLRNKLSSTFTSAKMKYMFPTIKKVAQELENTYNGYLKTKNSLNISDLNSRYTTDVIGTCAFGVECNTLKDPKAEVRRTLSHVFGRTNFNVKWYLFKNVYAKYMKFMGFKRHPQFIEDYFLGVLKYGLMEREKLGIRRKDFVDLLIDLKNCKDDNGNPGLTYNEITAQLFIFFFAGYETSSSSMSYALYLLAKHPEIQDKVRREIMDKLKEHNNEMTYEALNEMTYLDQVISESLRMYPILGFLQRHAVEDYKIPKTNIVLEKGTCIFIPVKSIHYDPEIYEQPEVFRPERFHPSEVLKRHSQSFLGFGDGPRNCIGLRFGRMQVRVGLATLLAKYKFSVCEKTVNKFNLSDHTFAQKTLDDVWLQVDKL